METSWNYYDASTNFRFQQRTLYVHETSNTNRHEVRRESTVNKKGRSRLAKFQKTHSSRALAFNSIVVCQKKKLYFIEIAV